MRRKDLAIDAQAVGEALNRLRQHLLETEYVYTAGLVRAAEEALVVAYNGLNDENTPEDIL